MTKDILDHPRAVSGTRTRAYAEIERRNAPEGSHEGAKRLHRHKTTAGGRVKPYTRIERGQTA
ncbi:hypothetical protein [Pseudoroseicyclus tamaricis]|uniref:Uncharacterized protein n=1 Tax=Pseudoroseicyclus tamaricis TaxID=2705421 RepID=A0A6B2K2P7_9RHOB|nr:hypothetical protein [Pseudoroseicyclus tamaricis]NDV02052.1 hypothetical protein [Pseudoroseicyclus tamaricis]